MNRRHLAAASLGAVLVWQAAGIAAAGVLIYGDADVLNTATYPGDPTAGATLEGLAVDAVTFGAAPTGHGFGFSPEADDYPGTDQIFVGSMVAGGHDGYSSSAPTTGPQTIVLDYASLLVAGERVETLTLGIAADDFQFPAYGQPFTAQINGAAAPELVTTLNAIDQGGPVVQFFTIGVEPAVLLPSHVLTLSIDGLGDGGDGWAIDFLTIGVTTASVPEPAAAALALTAGGTAAWRRRREAARSRDAG